MSGDSPGKRQLISYIKRKNPKISETEIVSAMNGIKRFVNLTRKIYTEPQAIVVYKDTIERGKTIKKRIFNVDLKELAKIKKNKGDHINENTLRELHNSLTGDKVHD